MVFIIEALRDDFDFVVVASDRAPDERKTLRQRWGRDNRRPRPDQAADDSKHGAPGANLAAPPAYVTDINMSDQGGGLTAFLAARLARGRESGNASQRNAKSRRLEGVPFDGDATKRGDRHCSVRSNRSLPRVAPDRRRCRQARPRATETEPRGTTGPRHRFGGVRGRRRRAAPPPEGWGHPCRAAALVHQLSPDIRFVSSEKARSAKRWSRNRPAPQSTSGATWRRPPPCSGRSTCW